MDCNGIRHFLDDFAEGELKPPEKEMVEEHLKACASCQNELSAIRRVARVLGEFGEVNEPDDFLQEVRQRIQARQEGAVFGRLFRQPALARALASVGFFLVLGFAIWLAYRQFWPSVGRTAGHPKEQAARTKEVARVYDKAAKLRGKAADDFGHLADEERGAGEHSAVAESKNGTYFEKYAEPEEVGLRRRARGATGDLTHERISEALEPTPPAGLPAEPSRPLYMAKGETAKRVAGKEAVASEKTLESATAGGGLVGVAGPPSAAAAPQPTDTTARASVRSEDARHSIVGGTAASTARPASEKDAGRVASKGEVLAEKAVRGPLGWGDVPDTGAVSERGPAPRAAGVELMPPVASTPQTVSPAPREPAKAGVGYEVREREFAAKAGQAIQEARPLKEGAEELSAEDKDLTGTIETALEDKKKARETQEGIPMSTVLGYLTGQKVEAAWQKESQFLSLGIQHIAQDLNGDAAAAYRYAVGAIPEVVVVVRDRQKALAEIKKMVADLGGTVETAEQREAERLLTRPTAPGDLLVVKLKPDAYRSLLARMVPSAPSEHAGVIEKLPDLYLDLSEKAHGQEQSPMTFLIRLVEAAQQNQSQQRQAD